MQFNPEQRKRALALLERMAWGDMEGYLRTLESALRLALDATAEDFFRWEDQIGPELEAQGFDEFSLPSGTVDAMSSEDKSAYVARLLRSLALSYGVHAEFGGKEGGGLAGEAYELSPAALLRGLNDILWLPMVTED
jgi:hypothetical protein